MTQPLSLLWLGSNCEARTLTWGALGGHGHSRRGGALGGPTVHVCEQEDPLPAGHCPGQCRPTRASTWLLADSGLCAGTPPDPSVHMGWHRGPPYYRGSVSPWGSKEQLRKVGRPSTITTGQVPVCLPSLSPSFRWRYRVNYGEDPGRDSQSQGGPTPGSSKPHQLPNPHSGDLCGHCVGHEDRGQCQGWVDGTSTAVSMCPGRLHAPVPTIRQAPARASVVLSRGSHGRGQTLDSMQGPDRLGPQDSLGAGACTERSCPLRRVGCTEASVGVCLLPTLPQLCLADTY